MVDLCKKWSMQNIFSVKQKVRPHKHCKFFFKSAKRPVFQAFVWSQFLSFSQNFNSSVSIWTIFKQIPSYFIIIIIQKTNFLRTFIFAWVLLLVFLVSPTSEPSLWGEVLMECPSECGIDPPDKDLKYVYIESQMTIQKCKQISADCKT